MSKNEKIKDSKNTVRVILNVPEDLNNSFNELAKKRGLVKSNMIIFAMSWYLDYSKSMDMMPKMVDLLKNPDFIKEIDGEGNKQ